MVSVFFLAAGKSNRISKITKNKPKPLIKINGSSILSRNFNWFRKSKLTSKYFVNTFFKPGDIKNEINKINLKYKISTLISHEKKLLGTAGAVKKLENKLGKLFFVCYSDNLLNFDLEKMMKYHKKKKSDITMAIYDIKKNPFTGIASSSIQLNRDKEIINFDEERGAKGSSKYSVNTGVIIFNNKIFKYIKKNKFIDFSKDVFPKLAKNKKIKFIGYQIEKKNGYCLALDTQDSYKKFLKIVKKIKLFN
jgi:NDP-sugar pyrophosphorylase family protein